ncbi:MAG: hypothetical protein OQL28_03805 [Sedimenticola sp.]|nr:hypothetical protein [Sedimenticola sp.]
MVDTSEFGIWAMLLFWASALGGIGLAIGWARMKGRNGAGHRSPDTSLKRRPEDRVTRQKVSEQKAAGPRWPQDEGRGHE